MDIIYRLVVLLFRLLTGTFFRDIVTRNSHAVPKKGPVVFVAAPHANQFVDPMILIQTCQRQIRFLIAAVSMRKWYIGLFGRLLNSIPVERPADLARTGTGAIHLDRDELVVLGEGTRFSREIDTRGSGLLVQIGLETFTAPVESIATDGQLRLRRPLEAAATQALQSRSMSFQIVPWIDQTAVYNEVIETLGRGEAVGIFPEGGSHDRVEMLPLKAGVCLMALGAAATYPELAVTIVPCGLNYFHPHRFRSRAVIEYGQPFAVDRSLAKDFSLGGEARRMACVQLLAQIRHALLDVTINVPDFETLQFIQTVRRLYRPTSRVLSTFEHFELTRRLLKGYLQHKNNPTVQQTREQIAEYNQLLNYHGLLDHQVKSIPISRLRALLLLVYRLAVLLVFGLAAFPGTILISPALFAIEYISRRAARKAKAKSTVKIEGRDVLATWKLLVGLFLFPSLDVLYTLFLVYELWLHGFDRTTTIQAALAVCFLLFPLLASLTVKFAEIGLESVRAISPLLFALFVPGRGHLLQEKRRSLRRAIKLLVNEFGPSVMADFEANRIVRRRQSDVEMHGSSTAASGMDLPVFSESDIYNVFSAIEERASADKKTA